MPRGRPRGRPLPRPRKPPRGGPASINYYAQHTYIRLPLPDTEHGSLHHHGLRADDNSAGLARRARNLPLRSTPPRSSPGEVGGSDGLRGGPHEARIHPRNNAPPGAAAGGGDGEAPRRSSRTAAAWEPRGAGGVLLSGPRDGVAHCSASAERVVGSYMLAGSPYLGGS